MLTRRRHRGLGGVAPFYPVSVPYSCRFKGVSGYLYKTFASAGNRQIWSVALNLKMCAFSSYQTLLGVYVDANNYELLSYNSDSFQFYWSCTVGGVAKGTVYFTPVFRDPSQHMALMFTRSGSTIKGYWNGTEMAQSVTSAVDSGDLFFGGAYKHEICGVVSVNWLHGYVSGYRFGTGTAWTPPDIGQFSTLNPTVYIPKAESVTYGTNGFHLDFANASDLGNDVSGNNNDFTSSGLATTDQFTDTPTNNCPTWNPVQPTTGTNTYSEGNLRLAKTDTGGVMNVSVVPFRIPSIGKWQVGIKHISNSTALSIVGIGQFTSDLGTNGYVTRAGVGTNGRVYTPDYAPNNLDIGALSANDTLSFLVDADAGSIKLKKNGTLVNSGNAIITGLDFSAANGWYLYFQSAGTGAVATFEIIAPTTDGSYLALCAANLTVPAADLLNSSRGFDANIYTGTGAAQNITSFDFQPDLVWLKNRSQADNHMLVDAVRGATKRISSNLTDAEATDANGLTAFLSTGFTLGTGANGYNDSAENFVSWALKESATYGMDIVSYTGTGVAHTVAHGLGAVPEMIVVKNLTTAARNWMTYHHKMAASPQLGFIYLSQTDAYTVASSAWNDTAPTSSNFTVGISAQSNQDTNAFIAYLFRSVPGFSKFGSYAGNGNADGPFVYCGFRPRWVLIKEISGTNAATSNWQIEDAARNTYNPLDKILQPNLANAESSVTCIDFLSNGFKLRTNNQNWNESGGTYIFAAFAEAPFPWNNAR